MNFGILKSKIENVLLESYKKGTFKTEIKNFKKYVLENKNISKLYYLYDELSSNKGMDKESVNDFINECVIIYENTINKVKSSELTELLKWTENITSDNLYESIDGLFSSNVLKIDNKIKSRKLISENLQKEKQVINESPNVPLSSVISIANKTVSNYISSLNESDRKELVSLLNRNDCDLKDEYTQLKESSILKLNQVISEEKDLEVTKKINETIQRVSNEKFDKLNYYRLKKLNEII
jgi:succinate dehydrogenase flavin-adding protein (antitoxin of CptAB toxin-antitoxin module)